MLRSLVGSEMCIRDSNRASFVKSKSLLIAFCFPITVGINFNPITIVFHACLLYTSDAADDLLCVDLGGRRIIKKKKL